MENAAYLTRQQVREFDRRAIEELGVSSLVLMENAGRNAAELIDRFMHDREEAHSIVVCGVGNNGGDGFVIGRHLLIRKRSVTFILVGPPDKLTPDCRTNRDIIVALGLPVIEVSRESDVSRLAAEFRRDRVIIDALLGTGFSGTVRSPITQAIEAINRGPHGGVAAVDVPSGLDADLGVTGPHTVRADLTISFVAAKVAFQSPEAAPFLGQVRVVDIGVPRFP